MNYELFIAKRIIAGKEYKNSISSPIIKIAIAAIALGVIIMMISIATGTGMQHKIRDKIAGFKGHIQITNYDNRNSEVSHTSISKDQEFYPEFTSISGVKNIQVYANKAGLIRNETTFEGVVLKGVSTDYDWSFFNEYLLEGDVPNFNQRRVRDVLLSKLLVNRLNLKLLDTIDVHFLKSKKNSIPSRYKFVLTGIYETGILEFDQNIIIGDIREVQRLNKWGNDEVGGFEIVLKDFDEIEQKGEEIFSLVGDKYSSDTILEMESSRFMFEWIDLFDNNIWFIIGIMILVASINMITALLVLILENISMIGLLKTLGSTNWSIRKVFLYNASYLIIKGLFWGNLIGIAILLIQKTFGIITLNPAIYYVSEVPVHFDIFILILLNISTLVLCFLMLIIPSIIIANIRPAKSMKFA